MTRLHFGLVGISLFALACSPSASQLKKLIEDNPDIVTSSIEKNPSKYIMTLQKAAQGAQSEMRQKEQAEEQASREEEYKNPKKPEIQDFRAVRGNKEAKVTIVEYSDFECPYCSRGYQTLEEVRKKYGDKVRVIYKHLPLDFHPLAMPAAKRFEAIRLQDHEKAYAFHDEVFKNQEKLRTEKEKFLDAAAKKVGVDFAKMKKDMESEDVKKVIAADIEEAKKFGIQGTPGFVVGGITLKGAYPVSEFDAIIERLLK